MAQWRLQPALATDTGKRRNNNEDAVGYLYPEDPQTLQDYGALFVIADGVGGLRGSQRASYVAVNMLVHEYYRSPLPTVEDRLRDVLQRANRMVIEQLGEGNKHATTVVAVVYHGRDAVIAHAGDSRAYKITRTSIEQITQDHTVTIRTSDGRRRDRLDRAIGHKPTLVPDIVRTPVEQRSSLLLVTDGATLYLKENDLKRIVTRSEPEGAVSEIIRRANEAGGADNISAIVINVIGDGSDFKQGAAHAAAINREIAAASDEKEGFAMVRRKTATFATLDLSARTGHRASQQMTGEEWGTTLLTGFIALVIIIAIIFAIVTMGG
ncbi:MAG: protein phosphatase 2C domain-containing protein, partial [Chloroflexota bacterium]